MASSPPPSAPPTDDEWSTETWIAVALGGAMILTVFLGLVYMMWRRYRGRTLTPRPTVNRGRVPSARASSLAQGGGGAMLFAPAPGECDVNDPPAMPLLAFP